MGKRNPGTRGVQLKEEVGKLRGDVLQRCDGSNKLTIMTCLRRKTCFQMAMLFALVEGIEC